MFDKRQAYLILYVARQARLRGPACCARPGRPPVRGMAGVSQSQSETNTHITKHPAAATDRLTWNGVNSYHIQIFQDSEKTTHC